VETSQYKTTNRPATVQKPAASLKTVQRKAVTVRNPVQLQTSMQVSSPKDPAEKEADATAKKIMRMAVPESSISYVKTEKGGVFRQVKQEEKDKKVQPKLQSPYITRFADSGAFTQRKQEDTIPRKAEGQPNIASNVSADIQNSMASGSPLPLSVRRFMEPRFQANFSNVKIQTGDKAAKLNRQLNAQAFTVGNQIFFGKDKFQPEHQEGKELIAYELTHTIQQGAAIQRSENVNVTQQAPVQVQRLGLSDALDYFADKANIIPGFRMFTIVLGVNPINMSSVDRSAANILRAIVEFIPGGALITKALDNYGVFEKVGTWVEQQIKSLGMVGSTIKQAITEFLDSLSWSDIFDLGGVWERAKRIFTEPIDRLIDFAKGLITGILKFIKDAILKPLAAIAQGTQGYDLLKATLGKDPITGEPVPRNPETLIGGFMKLIGQQEIWENIKKGNAIARAWEWFQKALAGLMSFVQAIPGKIIDTITSLTIKDIVTVAGAFTKVVGVFGNIASDFISWGLNTTWNLLEIVFDVVKPGLMGYIKKTGAALKNILKNPMPFLGNLVKAAKLGFTNFADNIGNHLKAGLIDWLTASLTGVYIPKALNLMELGKFALSILGITWAQIRGKIVKVLGPNGETIMKGLETGFDIVVALFTGVRAAAWELIKEKLTNLKDMVIGGIVDFVTDTIVKKAIPKIIGMFIPGAGFIPAIVSIYDTVMVFVQKISKIRQVVTAFIDSIVGIAGGAIGAATKRVEGVLAGLLSLAISFLAGFLGLGKVTDKIMGVIEKVRPTVDKAIDGAIAWIVGKAKALFAKLFGQKDKDKNKNEGSAQKAFSLPEEGHTVTAKAKGDNLKITIASDREGDILSMLRDAASEVASDKSRNKSEQTQILSDLESARKMVKEMENDWKATQYQTQDYPQWAEIRLTQIVNILSHLGADGIKAFRDFKGKPLDKRYLPLGYDVREKLYLRGSGWSGNQASVVSKGSAEVYADVIAVINNRTTNPKVADAAWNRLVNGLREPDSATKLTLKLQHLANTKYDVDHIDTLSISWQSGGGNNTVDADRWMLSNTSKLRYINRRHNRARTKGSYIPEVGKGFISVYAQGGLANAKEIDGQPFLDAPGGKPI
jgi:hypothetical protein